MKFATHKLLIATLGLSLVLTPFWSQAANVGGTFVNPPSSNGTTLMSLVTSADVNQVISITLTDGVAASSGGPGCVGVANTSAFATAVADTGTSTLGTYDVAFSTGAPTGAQGCRTLTSAAAIQTFSVDYTVPAAAQINVERAGTFTWSSVRAGVGDNVDWTSDSAGINIITTPTTLVSLTPDAGNYSTLVQVAWRTDYGAAAGAKTGQVIFTVFAP